MKLIRFAETWLTTNICTKSSTQNGDPKIELLISEKTHNNIKEINEEIIALEERKIPKSIIDTQQLMETLKKLKTRYDLILKIKDLVQELVNDWEILHGNLTEVVEEKQYKNDNDLSKSFFVSSCYCAAQGLDLLVHGYTRISLGKYAEGLQFISNGADYIMYGIFFSLVCKLNNLEETFNRIEKVGPKHISFRGLNFSHLSTYLNSQNDHFIERCSELKKYVTI